MYLHISLTLGSVYEGPVDGKSCLAVVSFVVYVEPDERFQAM